MQLITLSAGMGHAGNFCYPALLEALFVTAVVIGDELALPISQEGAGMSACPAWGKVVNDGIEPFMYRRGIGPEVRAMRSEERRVGKECRDRKIEDRRKKNINKKK